MEINIINETQFLLTIEQLKIIEKIAENTEKKLNINLNYFVSLIFVNSAEIHEINMQYRGIDRPTDVISFALKDVEDEYQNEELDNELGDIFINVDAIKSQALEYGHSENRELGFLFGHGLLHLLGYDHESKEDEIKMFQLQEEIIDEIIPRNH